MASAAGRAIVGAIAGHLTRDSEGNGVVDGVHQPLCQGGHGGADPNLLDTFIKVITGELANTSTTEHGMMSTAVGQAAELSRRENRTVFIEELFRD